MPSVKDSSMRDEVWPILPFLPENCEKNGRTDLKDMCHEMNKNNLFVVFEKRSTVVPGG